MCRAAMMTQSVGVPLTAKRRSSTGRSRSGSLSESECDTPDWSYSGATIHTSSESARAISAHTSSPSEWMPSSLVTRMRIAIRWRTTEDRGRKKLAPRANKSAHSRASGNPGPLAPGVVWPLGPRLRGDERKFSVLRPPSSVFLDDLEPAHIPLQRLRHGDGAVLLLVGFHHRDQRAADGDAGAVQGVDIAHRAVLGA